MTQNGLASVAPPRVAAVVNPSPGPPTSGAWLKGQQVIDSNGALWLCQSSGTPGTWVQLSVGGGNVDSFNGRVGAVTLQEADVLATFATKGGIMLGTGAGSGEELAVGANGTVLLADSTKPGGVGWESIALSYAAGNLGSNFSVGTTLATFLTTASLAVGTWEVRLNATVDISATTGGSVEVVAGLDTAAGSLSGMYSSEISATTAAAGTVSLSFIAVITGAGTVQFEALGSTGASAIVEATTPTGAYPNATGYTAVKIG